MATNKKIIPALLAFFISALGLNLNAQLKYWVKFKDKNGTPYSLSNPSAFLTSESIWRRTAFNIPFDFTDLPVTPSYISQVDNITDVTVLYASKWLNGVVVSITNTTVLTAINALPFVLNSNQVNKYRLSDPELLVPETPVQTAARPQEVKNTASAYNYGRSYWQNHQLNVDCLHDVGLRGQGIIIAVLDNGFHNVDIIPVFDSLRSYGNIKGTRDFVNGGTNVYNSGDHGTMVLSCMGANQPGLIVGSAPMASYWLLRTEEDNSEKISEEYNWIRGAEFADSVGARILTTSLGYTTFDNPSQNHTISQLDGRTAPMSIAANIAARKNIFVINAAGNGNGSGTWNYIGVPADADSICTVGAIDSLNIVTSFSSIGPTADGRIKPDLVARGGNTWVTMVNGQCAAGNGTSFSTPVLAGAVACMMLAHQSYSSMLLLDTLKHTASNAASPNNSIGWGKPNLCAIPVGIFEVKINAPEFSVFPNPFNNLVTINLNTVNYKVNSIQLVDVFGHVLRSESPKTTEAKINFNTGDLAAGVYFIKLNTSAGTGTKKIIKQ